MDRKGPFTPRLSRRTTTLSNLAKLGDEVPTDMHRSTILAGNIHCATCVNHIQNAVNQVGPKIQSVSVRVNEITVVHAPDVSTNALVQIVSEEGFDVYSARTVDKDQHVIVSETFDAEADGWFDADAERWIPSPVRRTINNWFLPHSQQIGADEKTDSRKRERHLQNCAECRANPEGTAHHLKTKPRPSRRTSAEGLKKVEEGAPRQRPDDSEATVAGQRWKVIMSIGGMTCVSCSNGITDALQKMKIVEKVQIDLMSNSGFVIYNGPKEEAKKITDEIDDLGYEASITEQTDLSAQTPGQAKSNMYRAKLSIEGMTCAACSSAITNGLDELDFVKSADIVLLTNSGEVLFEDRSNIDRILEKIDDLGYDASVEGLASEADDDASSQTPKERTVQVKVDGMFCENCPPRIIEALEERFGDEVSVEKALTLKTPIVTVAYEPLQPDRTIRSILEVIEKSQDDFKVSIYHPPSIEERSKAMQLHERNRLLRRLLIALACVIPTFVIGIVFMDLLPDANPLKAYFMETVWAGNVQRGEWAMFILATPAYFFAADVFHLRALKEIRALWRPGSRVPVLRRFIRFGSMNLLISAGTTVAYISSVALLIVQARGGSASSSSYFDSVVFLTFFILVGRFLEALSKSKTSDAVSMLGELRPASAKLIIPGTDAGSTSSNYTQPTKTSTIPADRLEIGDHVIVAHGASPPADGVIVVGEGKFDESSLTGESHPVTKGVGEMAFVGTVNSGSPLTLEVRAVAGGGSSMLDAIVAVVREGLARRAPVERLADVLTGYFVPIITGLAILTFCIWIALGYSGVIDPAVIDGQAGGWAFYALGFAISVFVAACPCGIGLAAPTALFVGIGLAARHGILVRGGGEAFQEAPNVDVIVFDKTGTLTEGGELKVANHAFVGDVDAKLMAAMAAQLEEQSSHPIAQAIVKFLSDKEQVSLAARDLNEEAGKGLRGTFVRADVTYEAAIGSAAFITSLSPDILTSNSFASTSLSTWQTQAQSVAVLAFRRTSDALANELVPDSELTWPLPAPESAMISSTWSLGALFATSDPLRPSSLPTVRALRAQGIDVYMLSGDNPTTAQAVAAELEIPAANVFAGVLPTGKADKIRELQRNVTPRNSRSSWFAPKPKSKAKAKPPAGAAQLPAQDEKDLPSTTSLDTSDRAHARVAFVGDGINDAPALLAADVSISLSTGSPIALTASAFVLLSPSLSRIPLLLKLSKRVMRRVALNYGWALVYNVVLVPVAAGVLWKVRSNPPFVLGPAWAAMAMAGSSVSVVVSSLMLRWEGKTKEEK